MIANTRKMNDLKNDIAYKMEREFYISDLFAGHVEGGFITEDMIEGFIKAGKCPEVRDMIKHISKEEIMSNPYIRDIKISKENINNISLGRKRYIPANTVTSYQEKTRDLDSFMPIDSYFICDRALRLPGIVEGDTIACWMSVEPFEINSFQSFIDEAKGNVCLCGCGLGYAAYMLSLKEDVKSITIVELNPDVILLFETYILPQFKNKDKIKIVNQDAIEYLKDNDLSRYDYVNVDIWRDTLDMLPLYMACLIIEKKYPHVDFSYWLEPTLKDLFRKSILEQFCGYSNKRSECFQFANAIAKDILDNTNISSKKDLQELLVLDDMRDILAHWYFANPQLYDEYKKISENTIQKMLKTLSIKGSNREDIKSLNKLFDTKFL